MISIQSINSKVTRSNKTAIQNAGHMTFQVLSIPVTDSVSVVLSDNTFLQSLNNEYRGIDKPTDVLSFPSGEVLPGEKNKYLGDIVISLPIATQQAEDAGHSVENELTLLTIHGILHLTGYDHDSPSSKKNMWDLQRLILNQLGVQMSVFSGDKND